MVPAPLECPGMEQWQALFGGALPADQRERYQGHLESCPACQDRLDRPDAFSNALREQARRLGDPTATPSDPVLTQILERLQGTPPPFATGNEPADLYFLQPTDRPGLLGTLGEYEVQEVIGQGGMGVVLKAYEPALHRLVAIKVLSPALAGSATARRRFTREAQAAAAVCHDHIVAVHGVHETDSLPYLVMQYIPGESLQARLDRGGPLEVEEIVRIGTQTAQGLAAAHAQGLIHRDVKPANLLLENGLAKVKITDFGLARMADDVGLTRDGVVAGTPEYMAPEQARGEAVDHRADLFSLGSVLYALCTGHPPFRASTTLAVIRRVNEEEPKPIRTLNAAVPAWLEALVNRLLAKEPDQRFQSAAEVAALLEGYLAHLRQPATVPAPELPSSRFVASPGRSPMPRRTILRIGVLAAVGLASVLGLVALAVRMLGPGSTPPVDPGTKPEGIAVVQGADPLEPADGLACLLVNKNSGRCLSIADGSSAPGARIVQGPTPDQASATERWTLLRAGDAFRLRNEGSGLVLEIGSANLDPGVQAIQWHDKIKAPNQHWTFEPVEDCYVLRVAHSQFVLGVGQSEMHAGAPALQWHYAPGVLDQRWELRPAYSQEASWSFRGTAANRLPFEPFGPEAEQDVRFEEDGLRITLPPGSPLGGATGVRSTFAVRGDFEITVGFEILQQSAPNARTRFTLALPLDRPGFNMASLSRAERLQEAKEAPLLRMAGALVGQLSGGPVPAAGPAPLLLNLAGWVVPGRPPTGGYFQAWTTLVNERTGMNNDRSRSFPARARAARLRLVRSGSTLSYFAADGADGLFVLLQKYPFGDEDLKEVRFVGAIDDPAGSLDVRVHDVRIRAASLPNLTGSPGSGPGKTALKGKAMWIAGGLIGLMIFLGALGVWLAARARGRAGGKTSAGAGKPPQGQTAPPSLSFACPACGKKLKGKAQLAGKTVPCPACGKTVQVPGSPAASAHIRGGQ